MGGFSGASGRRCRYWQDRSRVGALSLEPTPFPLFKVLGKSLALRGYLLHEMTSRPVLLETTKAYVIAGLEEGTLRPVIAKTFDFEQIVAAHQYLEAGEQFGKVVVTLESDS